VLPPGRLPSFASVIVLCRRFVRDRNPGFRRGIGSLGIAWVAMDASGSPVARAETNFTFSDLAEPGRHAIGAARHAGLLARVRPGQPALGNHGGGQLLLLDSQTGAVLERFGSGITLGLAADPSASRLFVATAAASRYSTRRRAFLVVFVGPRRRSGAGAGWHALRNPVARWGQRREVDRRGRASVVLDVAAKASRSRLA